MTEEKQTLRYPRCVRLGLNFVVDKGSGINVIPDSELKAVLSPEHYRQWEAWSRGSTLVPAGFYPWDVEDFLTGRPNLD